MSTNSGTAHSQTAQHTLGYVSGRWVIDPVHSDISFVVRHLMVSRVRGRFVRFSGEIVTGADPSASTVAVEIDMESIDTGNADRDDDLRSDRKSTRLNSSHLGISYAVFCLKN